MCWWAVSCIEAVGLLNAGDLHLVYSTYIVILAGVSEATAFQISDDEVSACGVDLSTIFVQGPVRSSSCGSRSV